MAGLVLVEGLPGAGKTTVSRWLEQWGRGCGVPVRYVAEGRTDHPADLDQVAVLRDEELHRLLADGSLGEEVVRAAEPHEGYVLVRDRERAGWPEPQRAVLRAHDAYDGGEVGPDLHRRALLDSWRRFAAAAAGEPWAYVFECVLLQNPVCALLARFDRPEAELARHVRALAATVEGLDPLLVYLDAGDPEPVLAAAAAQRPAAWLEFVVRYHTEQGYGLARGLRGVAGLVEFLRVRRELELRLLDTLPLRTCVIDAAGSSPRERQEQRDELAAALGWTQAVVGERSGC